MQVADTATAVGSQFMSESMTRRINFRAGRLRRKFGLSRADEMDVRHEFWIALVRAAKRFDATRSQPDRYAKMVLNSRYKDFVRTRMRAKENEQPEIISIEDVEPAALGLMVDPSAETVREQAELLADLHSVINSLPLADQRICHAVMASDTPSDAARRLGVSHPTVPRALRRLRPLFAAKGITNIS